MYVCVYTYVYLYKTKHDVYIYTNLYKARLGVDIVANMGMHVQGIRY